MAQAPGTLSLPAQAPGTLVPCYRPIEAWRSTERTVNGKNRIVFDKSETTKSLNPIHLPCGTCIGCKLDRSLMWAIRCVHEAQQHNQNSFITLTYSDDNLPTDRSLTHSHYQTFIRELRRQYPSLTIRYYMCGEYGTKPRTLDMKTSPGKLHRPHYHACLFGIDFPDKEIFKEDEGIITYTSDKLTSIWGRGFTTTGDLNFDTAAYTARYIAKKVTGEKAEEHYQTTCHITGNLINLEPEYNTMSRRPGIAYTWFQKYVKDIYPSDYLIHEGHKVKTPRYYDNQLTDEGLELIKEKRKVHARKNQKDNTPERLAVREKVKQLKYIKLTRSYENES
nr:MAG: replication initiation protein [Microvirus sp.]